MRYATYDRPPARSPQGGPETRRPPQEYQEFWRKGPATRNGMAIVGFLTGLFSLPLFGLLFSVIGLAKIRRTRQRGRLLASVGIVLSLVWIAAWSVAVATLGGKVSRVVFDPGCRQAEAAAREMSPRMEAHTKSGDLDALDTDLRAALGQFDQAANVAEHSDVKAAIVALRTDFTALRRTVKTGKAPNPSLESKMQAHGRALDNLCALF